MMDIAWLMTPQSVWEFTNGKQLFRQCFDPLCQQVAYEVNFLPADFLVIATQGLVNTKYWGSQIRRDSPIVKHYS
jgi:hypothetical protein